MDSIVSAYKKIYVIDMNMYKKMNKTYNVNLIDCLFAIPKKHFPEQVIDDNVLNNYNYTRDINYNDGASYVLDSPIINMLIVKKYLCKFLKKINYDY